MEKKLNKLRKRKQTIKHPRHRDSAQWRQSNEKAINSLSPKRKSKLPVVLRVLNTKKIRVHTSDMWYLVN